MKEDKDIKVFLIDEIMQEHRFYMKHIVENEGIQNRNYHCNKIKEDRSEEYLSINERSKNGLHFSPRRKKDEGRI
ncbi:MAG: hypothetical protein ACJ0OP_00575 [Thermodesulfobacteriota bacterium]